MERNGLGAALDQAIALVHRSFQVVGPISVTLDHEGADPNASSLVIQAPVTGDPLEVSRAHWEFAREAADSLGQDRERICLLCDIR